MSKKPSEWKSVEEIRAHLISKASDDSAFRASLLADPKATVSAELNMKIPEQVSVSVLEDSPTAVHLVLPPSALLRGADLKAISGGTDTGWGCESHDCYDPSAGAE